MGHTEFELKFVGAPRDVAALPESRFFRALNAPSGSWERLTSTYYDTDERALERRAFSLRLREERGGLVQAVKRANGVAGVSRSEFETEIPDAALFPAMTGDGEIDELISTLNQELRPVARTTVDRFTAIVGYGGSRIEFAVDLGRAEGWDGRNGVVEAPLAEAELELVDGRPEDVFELGRLLAGNAPLRLSLGAKLEFAVSLSRGGPYAIAPQPRIPFRPDTLAVDALQETIAAIAARITAMQPMVLEARKSEGVHQMRVALRRLQAVERIFRPFLATGALRALAQQARMYRQAMGDARDWDVFLGETLPAASRNNYAPDGVRRLRARAETLRAEAWARAVGALCEPGFTAFAIDLAEAASIAAWRADIRKGLAAPLGEFAPRALDRAREVMLTTAETIDRSRLAGYHPLRIALKKLRYPVQMFRPIYAKERRREFMGALAGLQVAFGGVNDAAVAETLADKAAAGEDMNAMRAAGFICGYRAAEADAAARAIDAAWPEFAAMAPFWRD